MNFSPCSATLKFDRTGLGTETERDVEEGGSNQIMTLNAKTASEFLLRYITDSKQLNSIRFSSDFSKEERVILHTLVLLIKEDSF